MIAVRWIIVLVLASSVQAGCRERYYSRFPDLQGVDAQNALQRGWLPESLPESAIAIQMMHDIDTGEVWGAFGLGEEGLQDFLGDRRYEPADLGSWASQLPRRSGNRAEWWPTYLSQGQPKASELDLECLVLHEDAWTILIEKRTLRGYFWHY